jgi:hypothetical protein
MKIVLNVASSSFMILCIANAMHVDTWDLHAGKDFLIGYGVGYD